MCSRWIREGGLYQNGILGNQENQLLIDFLLLFFGGGQLFSVEKIYFGIHFQFLSLQSKTNVLSVGNKNYKRQHTSYKLEMDQNFEPRDYSKSTANQVSMREREMAEKNQTNATSAIMHHIMQAI